MSELQKALNEYLAVRRALGFKLEKQGRLLENFVDFLQRQGASFITRDLAVRWAMDSPHGQPAWWASRLKAVRGFARHRAGVDPRTQIPAPVCCLIGIGESRLMCTARVKSGSSSE